jgi:hypothetical protein
VRPWLARLGTPALDRLNAFAEEAGLRTESGRPVRFVPPHPADPYYEVHVFETGCVSTRPENRHDLFNALAWLAFPRTKARLNAMHAAEIPGERGRRGRKRDLLTLLDEGGVIVQCQDEGLIQMLRGFRWKELFWHNRERVLGSMRLAVLGHAVLEKALEPWPGISCKAVLVAPGADPDEQAAAWLAGLPADATPKDIPVMPVFGYPGWLPGSDSPALYDDTRYFRPSRARETPGTAAPALPGPLPDARR